MSSQFTAGSSTETRELGSLKAIYRTSALRRLAMGVGGPVLIAIAIGLLSTGFGGFRGVTLLLMAFGGVMLMVAAFLRTPSEVWLHERGFVVIRRRLIRAY